MREDEKRKKKPRYQLSYVFLGSENLFITVLLESGEHSTNE